MERRQGMLYKFYLALIRNWIDYVHEVRYEREQDYIDREWRMLR